MKKKLSGIKVVRFIQKISDIWTGLTEITEKVFYQLLVITLFIFFHFKIELVFI